jgi:hypothetical protein
LVCRGQFVTTQHNAALLCRSKASNCALADHTARLFGKRSVDVQRERINIPFPRR